MPKSKSKFDTLREMLQSVQAPETAKLAKVVSLMLDELETATGNAEKALALAQQATGGQSNSGP